jgi:hypothetical protein
MQRHLYFSIAAIGAVLGAVMAPADARQPDTGDNVILVTLDGARTEELFGGLDLDVLRSTVREGQKAEETPAYKRFWAPTPQERRAKLMPFLWNLVTTEGSIAGDAASGSAVRLRNGHWFSYPGYAEILLGEPHDTEIKSNDPIRNPFPTVLEAIRERHGLPAGKVATFASWSVFNQIVEHREGATFTSAGVEPYPAGTDRDLSLINQLQADTQTPWDGTRFDSFTVGLAMKHLAAARPRVLYLALDETDDWAHDGNYGRTLEALARSDGSLKQLWAWVQAQPEYRGRTHLLITTDHGRGHTAKDWRDHGATVVGANETWIAFVSPKMAQRGLWKNHEPLSTSQVAATIAGWMGVDWNAAHPNAGRPIR